MDGTQDGLEANRRNAFRLHEDHRLWTLQQAMQALTQTLHWFHQYVAQHSLPTTETSRRELLGHFEQQFAYALSDMRNVDVTLERRGETLPSALAGEAAEPVGPLSTRSAGMRQLRLACLKLACKMLPENVQSSDIEDVVSHAERLRQYVVTGETGIDDDDTTGWEPVNELPVPGVDESVDTP